MGKGDTKMRGMRDTTTSIITMKSTKDGMRIKRGDEP